jgi:hypothetical protein
MSSEIASTNAYDFEVDDIDVTGANYDDVNGLLSLEASLQYTGKQHPDKSYSSSKFYLDVRVLLYRRGNRWEFNGKDSLEILNCESDMDRDYMQQAQEAPLS